MAGASAVYSPGIQMALDGFESLGIGAEDLPQGVGELSRKELVFVNRLLEHGQMAQAAVEAGYNGERAGAGVWASKTLRKAKVFRVYSAALKTAAADADQLVSRVYERSALWHSKAKAAAQEVADLDELILSARKDKTGGKYDETLKEFEQRRARMLREERHYAGLAQREDTLLGSLLGRLNLNVNVSGEVDHIHRVGDEVTNEFARLRRGWEASKSGRN